MPAIPKSLERLFKQAGRAEEARLRSERREAQEEARQRARERRRQRRARTHTPVAACAVWEWLKGPQAAALRAGLRAARTDSLMILGWIDEEGQQHDDARNEAAAEHPVKLVDAGRHAAGRFGVDLTDRARGRSD